MELLMTIPNPKRKVLKHLKYVIAWDLFSTSPEFDILLRPCWHHVCRHLMFCFRSSFLADKEANNNLLCQGTPCSLAAVTAGPPHSPNSLYSDLSIPLCTKQNMPLVWCIGLFFTNSEHRFTVYAIFLAEIGFWFGILTRQPLYILPLHNLLFSLLYFPWIDLNSLEQDRLDQLKSSCCLYISWA